MEYPQDLQPDSDPALKAALKGAFGSHTASRELRERVMMAMATAGAVAPQQHTGDVAEPSRWSIQRWLTQPMTPALAMAAVAAVVLLVSGVWMTVNTVQSRNAPGGRGGIVMATPQPFPSNIAVALAARHDAALRGDRSVEIVSAGAEAPVADLKAVLRAKLGRTPWIADVRPAGWKLASVQVGKVEQTPAGQVVYAKGARTLSVITMAAPASCAEISLGQFQSKLGSHAMAGFTSNGTLYSLVLQSSEPTGVALAEVTALRDQFKDEILADAEGCAATAPSH